MNAPINPGSTSKKTVAGIFLWEAPVLEESETERGDGRERERESEIEGGRDSEREDA